LGRSATAKKYVFVSIVLFYVLFVCRCVLYYCHRVSTQLQLTNISAYIPCMCLYNIIVKTIIHYVHGTQRLKCEISVLDNDQYDGHTQQSCHIFKEGAL